jgi:nicotinamidase-related amidase
MEKRALLIIDMLNDFVEEGAPLEVPNTRKVLASIRTERDRARKDGEPVIYVCDAHDTDDEEFRRFGWPAHGVKGSRGAQVIDALEPSEGDIVIEKTSYSGFYRTQLESTLRTLGVNTLRLTGCVTHICILFIAYEAVLRGYTVETVEEGVAGLAQEDHDAALRIMKNVLGVTLV